MLLMMKSQGGVDLNEMLEGTDLEPADLYVNPISSLK